MFESILWYVSAFAGAIYLLSPLVAHNAYRFNSRCRLRAISPDTPPDGIAEEFERRISEFASSGFELVGCFDCGVLAQETRSYLAYFCNHTTNESANVSAMTTQDGPASYVEISSRFSNGQVIETNTNAILPAMPGNPDVQVFRFPSVEEPRALLKMHRRLVEKHAPGLCAIGEPRDAEVERYVRTIENYGPRLAKAGYMKLEGEAYRLTWKGAFRVAWLALWPVTLLRRAVHGHAMQLELRSLPARSEAALQKA